MVPRQRILHEEFNSKITNPLANSAVTATTFVGSLAALAGEVQPSRSTAPESPQEHVVTIQEIESTNFDADLSPGESTVNAPAELDEIDAPQNGYLESLGFRSPIRYLVDPLKELHGKTGLRIGVAHKMLFFSLSFFLESLFPLASLGRS